jgi:hypothetical protein
MKSVKSFMKRGLPLLGLLVAVCSVAHAQVVEPAGVPNPLNTNETQFQHETHFLTFIGSFVPESAQTAKAYYAAIDPTNSKPTFPQWLKNAGFIGNVNQWHAYGAQTIVENSPGVYGDNIINTDSHAIVLNAADLGFVRNQFIRCKPSCAAPNPIIYTYLENYPVRPFAAGGTNFGNPNGGNSYPTQAEATAAINSALNRPLGDINGNPICTDATTCLERIADVAFEWAPSPTNPTSSTRYGQLYAYVFNHDSSGVTETISVPPHLVGLEIPNFATGGLTTINAGDPFPPNLDGLGFKQHPGVCFICHGGTPQNLTSAGAYPRQGNVNGFRMLPLDIRNLIFTSDLGPEPTSRFNQEADIKRYNKAVLLTARGGAGVDDQGVMRQSHIAEVIRGWYAGYPGDVTMSASTQNPNFIPKGWLEPAHGGTAPAGSENLYLTTVAPSCRSCHFNRELSLDFGTAANFRQESDLKELVLLPLCQSNNPDPNKRPMPLAHLTYQRLWQANSIAQTLPSGQPTETLFNTAELIANYFGFNGTAGYCASKP